jgi:hypothetical protein
LWPAAEGGNLELPVLVEEDVVWPDVSEVVSREPGFVLGLDEFEEQVPDLGFVEAGLPAVAVVDLTADQVAILLIEDLFPLRGTSAVPIVEQIPLRENTDLSGRKMYSVLCYL